MEVAFRDSTKIRGLKINPFIIDNQKNFVILKM